MEALSLNHIGQDRAKVVEYVRRIAVTVESEEELQALRKVGRVVALAREEMRRAAEPGMTARELDRICCRAGMVP